MESCRRSPIFLTHSGDEVWNRKASLGSLPRRGMGRHRVRRLPVVENGRLVGVVAQADVALEANEKDAGAMLEGISQPTSTPRE